MILTLRREEELIQEKKKELRKLIKRRMKVEEKERDCVEEMKEVKQMIENLRREAKKAT